jgi:hypothetical protein
MNFAPIWKLYNAGLIDAFQAYAMCDPWVTIERFNRQYFKYMERTKQQIPTR